MATYVLSKCNPANTLKLATFVETGDKRAKFYCFPFKSIFQPPDVTPFVGSPCHESCAYNNERYCWGEGASMCQTRKFTASTQIAVVTFTCDSDMSPRVMETVDHSPLIEEDNNKGSLHLNRHLLAH